MRHGQQEGEKRDNGDTSPAIQTINLTVKYTVSHCQPPSKTGQSRQHGEDNATIDQNINGGRYNDRERQGVQCGAQCFKKALLRHTVVGKMVWENSGLASQIEF